MPESRSSSSCLMRLSALTSVVVVSGGLFPVTASSKRASDQVAGWTPDGGARVPRASGRPPAMRSMIERPTSWALAFSLVSARVTRRFW